MATRTKSRKAPAAESNGNGKGDQALLTNTVGQIEKMFGKGSLVAPPSCLARVANAIPSCLAMVASGTPSCFARVAGSTP